ncbi:thioredoxin reductase (NADPH) [Robiginitalea myxolifaciens]|uniref:Thioredoxin reductase (NADPH) n=1 Tax=Robiginitalea myxolifaciens TaxID=400055 RepID=A0A1I6HAU2_9FLAO|nr:cyclic nucleotide-binding domain-containing thioredoxin-disulfide reductase [Robiginitalea myxolifaciens]SFR51605.1 thioredoxin reductase (NADPH) [Robiginitalea myxolifaciens]
MTDPRFPVLTLSQINILKDYGQTETFEEETRVFAVGDDDYDFFVILSGEICVKDEAAGEKIIVTHGVHEFSGDNSMLSTRRAQFNGYASKGTTLLRIRPEKLRELIAVHSDLSDILLGAFLQRQETMLQEFTGGIKLIGSDSSKATYELRDFMEKNHIWHTFLDIDRSEEAQHLLDSFGVAMDELPILLNPAGEICRQPSVPELARQAGVLMDFEDSYYDVLVIGAGPAGLAASVYAASEGLSVVTIDGNAPGGQAGKSSKIENYLGFPTGISGNDLANKAYIQAQKFGCHISIPHRAKYIEYDGDVFTLCATNEKQIKARVVIAATGANYRQLPIDNIEAFEGSGVYYSATGMNAASCKNELVGVVGGGNSAGQAALFLANHAKEVHIIIRGDDLGAKMSEYLVKRILASPNITLHKETHVVGLKGSHHLESVVLDHNGEEQEIGISNLFTFIGAQPCTDWLNGVVATDEKGFIFTGADVLEQSLTQCSIYNMRKPQSLETSVPGFFAVGDVRKGSVKRVASAVGEGSMAISQVHQYLAEKRMEAVAPEQ